MSSILEDNFYLSEADPTTVTADEFGAPVIHVNSIKLFDVSSDREGLAATLHRIADDVESGKIEDFDASIAYSFDGCMYRHNSSIDVVAGDISSDTVGYDFHSNSDMSTFFNLAREHNGMDSASFANSISFVTGTVENETPFLHFIVGVNDAG